MKFRWLMAVVCAAGLPLMHAACVEAEPYLVSAVNVPCDGFDDCYEHGRYLLGTQCIEGVCMCPPWLPKMYRFPCCQKGRPADDCYRQCRELEECDPKDVDVSFLPPGTVWPPPQDDAGTTPDASCTTSSSSSSSGNVVEPECAKAADCPKPEEPRCAEAVCEGGKCGFAFKPVEKILSQIKGDCISQYCDGQGKVIALPDGEDAYNDGKQCTFDYCQTGAMGDVEAVNLNFPDGAPCPETGIGVCFEGECVDCVDGISACLNGQVCSYTTCVPMHCDDFNFQPLLGETDLDCGGLCRPCPALAGCGVDADCADGVCMNGSCKPPSCSDGVKNGEETGIDCGGPPSCPRCAVGQGCGVAGDCESGVCWAGVCEGA